MIEKGMLRRAGRKNNLSEWVICIPRICSIKGQCSWRLYNNVYHLLFMLIITYTYTALPPCPSLPLTSEHSLYSTLSRQILNLRRCYRPAFQDLSCPLRCILSSQDRFRLAISVLQSVFVKKIRSVNSRLPSAPRSTRPISCSRKAQKQGPRATPPSQTLQS
jgi:hypothetical protein